MRSCRLRSLSNLSFLDAPDLQPEELATSFWNYDNNKSMQELIILIS